MVKDIQILSLSVVSVLFLFTGAVSCSHSAPVKSQAYAALQSKKTFEYDFPTVWKGIEAAVHQYQVTDRDPSDVDPLELKKITQRSLDTDWIYSQSRTSTRSTRSTACPKRSTSRPAISTKCKPMRSWVGSKWSCRTKRRSRRSAATELQKDMNP